MCGVYQKQPEGFEDKLLELLSAGGVKGFREALEPFGLDPADPVFWKDSIDAHLGSLMEGGATRRAAGALRPMRPGDEALLLPSTLLLPCTEYIPGG